MESKLGNVPLRRLKLRPPVSLSDFSDMAIEFIEALRSLKQRPFVRPFAQGPLEKTALSFKDVPWIFRL